MILCGGSGTRLWPMSRSSFPKQFTCFFGEKSIFQETVLRFRGSCFLEPLIVTNEEFRFIILEQLVEIDVSAEAILIEPQPKNTGPAICAAAVYLRNKYSNEQMIVAASDHLIGDLECFRKSVLTGAEYINSRRSLLVFGVVPSYPATGFGYIQMSKSSSNQISKVIRFVEKPNFSDAKIMFSAGDHLWNSGIFMFSVESILDEFEDHESDILNAMNSLIMPKDLKYNFIRFDKSSWEKIKNISIDFCIMEKSKNISALSLQSSWSDLGDWRTIWKESSRDISNNSISSSNVTAIDCQGSLLRSDSNHMELVAIGLKDIAVVATSDSILVMDLGRSQQVKVAVESMREKKKRQADYFPKSRRPWGWFESLSIGEKYQVKKLSVKPGCSLSLQSHKLRSEHWVVVSGLAEVTIEKSVKVLKENESVYIKHGTKHRLKNLGDSILELIEVQTGIYFGEDDIVRYDDVYERN